MIVIPHWLKSFMCLHVISSACHDERFSLIFTYLPFYFNLSFPVFFHSSVLMHPDLHTDLDNLDSVENNLRHSAKGSLDAYDLSCGFASPSGWPSSLLFTVLTKSSSVSRRHQGHCFLLTTLQGDPDLTADAALVRTLRPE